MLENRPIHTQLGVISGRDAIYLDTMEQEFNRIIFKGEFNGIVCTKNETGQEWVPYKLSFNQIQAFDCRELEISKWEVVSSFDEVVHSGLLNELGLDGKGYSHYILSTYDYVYSIIAKEFDLELTGSQ
jgi:hypothetical protein